jgi:hypothetical protein
VGLTLAMFAFLFTQAKLLERFALDKDGAPKP